MTGFRCRTDAATNSVPEVPAWIREARRRRCYGHETSTFPICTSIQSMRRREIFDSRQSIAWSRSVMVYGRAYGSAVSSTPSIIATGECLLYKLLGSNDTQAEIL